MRQLPGGDVALPGGGQKVRRLVLLRFTKVGLHGAWRVGRIHG
jgi:hypothetical protein